MNKPLHSFLRLAAMVIIFITAGTVSAQTTLSQTLPLDPKLRTGKLQNGLSYYIRENKKPEQKVELRLVVNAGAINEDDDQQGLAHMAEHMAFNGTKRFKKNDIVSFLQDIGVGFGNDLNAYTGFDETVYILPIPTDKPDNLEKGFQILEDWAHEVTYLDQDIDGERPVILEESRLGKGANDRMFKKIYPALFEGSKYANRLPIGLDSIIKNFQYPSIRRFYKEWYRPELMAVIVVGDVSADVAEEMIKKHFAAIKNPDNSRPRTSTDVPAYTSSQALIVTDKEATRYTAVINYPAYMQPPSVTLGDYRNGLIENIFTSLFNQRLQELTQKENPPFLGARADFSSYARGYKAFSLEGYAGTGDPLAALKALVEETERVKRFGFTQPELERAKKSLMSGYERAYNDREKNESANYVQEYLSNFLEREPAPGIENEFEYVKNLLPNISLEEVNAFSLKFSKEKNRLSYITGPEPKTEGFLPDAKKLMAAIEETEKKDISPYEEKALAKDLLKNAPKPGKIISTGKNALLGTTELKLSNGVTVTLKPTDFKDDQVVMGAVRAGGKNNYGLRDKYNTEYLIPSVNAMGFGDFSPTDLRKMLAGKSVSMTPVFGENSDGVKGSSSVKDLETLFQLTYLSLTQPRRDSVLFKTFLQKNKSQFANIGANPQAVFVDSLYSTLFQGNPLAPVVVPKSANFDKVNINRVMAIYKERFGNANGMHYVFTGSFKEETILPLIERYIASIPSTPGKFSAADNKVRPVAGKKKLVVNKGKEKKSLIVAFYTGATPYSEDLELKMEALGQILNIRIIEELREKIQGIYGGGISTSLEKIPYGNYSVVLQLPCGPEKVDTLLKAVDKEFKYMVQHGPDQSYLDKVKQQWREEYKVSVKDNDYWLKELLTFKFPGNDPARFLQYEKYIDKLTVKDVQQAAALVLAGKNQLTGILMPGE